METIGSLIDKLSINELKIYHMTEQRNRDDVGADFRHDCENRLNILVMQRNNLVTELQELLDEVMAGKRKLTAFRQMKMYNEKKFKD